MSRRIFQSGGKKSQAFCSAVRPLIYSMSGKECLKVIASHDLIRSLRENLKCDLERENSWILSSKYEFAVDPKIKSFISSILNKNRIFHCLTHKSLLNLDENIEAQIKKMLLFQHFEGFYQLFLALYEIQEHFLIFEV